MSVVPSLFLSLTFLTCMHALSATVSNSAFPFCFSCRRPLSLSLSASPPSPLCLIGPDSADLLPPVASFLVAAVPRRLPLPFPTQSPKPSSSSRLSPSIFPSPFYPKPRLHFLTPFLRFNLRLASHIFVFRPLLSCVHGYALSSSASLPPSLSPAPRQGFAFVSTLLPDQAFGQDTLAVCLPAPCVCRVSTPPSETFSLVASAFFFGLCLWTRGSCLPYLPLYTLNRRPHI